MPLNSTAIFQSVPAVSAYSMPAAAALHAQRLGGRQDSYNDEVRTAAPMEDPLPPCILGARKLITCFPHHTQVPRAGLRLIRNDWTHSDIAKGQLHARGRLSKDTCARRAATLRKQVLRNGELRSRQLGLSSECQTIAL